MALSPLDDTEIKNKIKSRERYKGLQKLQQNRRTKIKHQNLGFRCYHFISFKLSRKQGFMEEDFSINNQIIFSLVNKIIAKLVSWAYEHLQMKKNLLIL